MILEVVDVQVSGCVGGDAFGRSELGIDRGAAIACAAVEAAARICRDRSVRVDLTNDVVAGIADVFVAVAIDREAMRVRQSGGDRGTAVSRVPVVSGARDRGQ